MSSRSNHRNPAETNFSDPELASESVRQVYVVQSSGRTTALWIMTVLLGVMATALVMRWDESRLMQAAWAQAGNVSGAGQVGARGIYAFTGQLTSKAYGLFMLDVDTGTIWCYEIRRGVQGEPQLKLVTARSWIWDRYLEEYNVAAPIPGAVRAMVEQQRSQRQDLLGLPEKTTNADQPVFPQDQQK